MQLNVETLSLINGCQALVLAVMLWFGTHGGSSHAIKGLRLRATALLLEAGGDLILALASILSPLVVLLCGNTLNLSAQAVTVVALRMVLQRPLRWRVALLLGVAGWLCVIYFSAVHPNYLRRVLWGSFFLSCNGVLNIAALWGGCRKRGTRAQCLLLWTYVYSIALLVWRNISLWTLATPLQGINAPSNVNTVYVLLIGIQPLLASIGFLLLYNEILQRELYELARIDPLTGVTNRLGLLEASETLLAHARRKRESINSTPTTSRASTIALDTTTATVCCWSWWRTSGACCEPATWSGAWVARSFWCCRLRWRRTTCSPWPNGSVRRSTAPHSSSPVSAIRLPYPSVRRLPTAASRT
jgi:hypothetical protein